MTFRKEIVELTGTELSLLRDEPGTRGGKIATLQCQSSFSVPRTGCAAHNNGGFGVNDPIKSHPRLKRKNSSLFYAKRQPTTSRKTVKTGVVVRSMCKKPLLINGCRKV